ncbi:unnamed protein product [Porites evermanni]|uniref:Ciliary microtubule inner protein 2C n=1 Tax=Porites evermanni TaxID=104178 RepID=A0ABN8MD08_9CNID|nr:unnamed protein product [Porites evermanni]
MFSPHTTTNLTTYQDPNHMPGYAGYCPRAKFVYHGDTFGNTTAKCFQDRRKTKLSTSITHDPGITADGQHRFPTVYSNTPDLVLSARARTRERWRNAKKYSLFNEHQRGREVQEFDKLSQNHRNHYMDRTGTVQRVERFVMPRKEPIVARGTNSAENSSLLRKDFKIKCPISGIFVSEEDKDFRSHHNHPFKMSPPSTCTWRDRALRDIYFEKR